MELSTAVCTGDPQAMKYAQVPPQPLRRSFSDDQSMKIRKHQLLDDALPDHILDEPLNPRHILQHMFIRLTDLALNVDVREEPLSDRKRFLVPLAVLPYDRILRVLV